MFEIRNVGTEVAMTVVDGITVPHELLKEVEKIVAKEGRTHFIGVVEKRNPDFKPPETLSISDCFRRPIQSAYIMTGEFAVSDSREAIFGHGCSKLVWVLPKFKAKPSAVAGVENPPRVA